MSDELKQMAKNSNRIDSHPRGGGASFLAIYNGELDARNSVWHRSDKQRNSISNTVLCERCSKNIWDRPHFVGDPRRDL